MGEIWELCDVFFVGEEVFDGEFLHIFVANNGNEVFEGFCVGCDGEGGVPEVVFEVVDK